MTAFARPESIPRPRTAASASRRGAEAGRFGLPTTDIERIAETVLAAAKAGGATAAETEVSQAVGQSVTVRRGEVETIAHNRDRLA